MSRSEDENELDSYGVWVKHSSGDENLPEADNETTGTEVADDSLDLPDFDDSDFSDMFKDEPEVSADDFGSDLDSTLSPDELANITGSGDVTISETTEAPAEADAEVTTDSNMDFEMDDSIPEENPADGFVEVTADSADEEISLDDFGFDEVSEPSESAAVEETPAEESFEITEDAAPSADGSEEEISLDDFMDGGFSDESVASGNNGFEEGKGPSASGSSEEVSLDEFVDMNDFDAGPAPEAKSEEIVDEAPLDMDISFDSSAESVQTEENISVENEFYEEEDTEAPVETEVTEEVSIDDFSTNIETTEKSDDTNIDTEDIDLSDFGIDSNAEETPIVQDVEEAKNKEVIVDYDLSVGDENMSAAPVVNEIKSTVEDSEPVEEMAEEVSEVAPGSEVVSSSLLQQIVDDLSGLKDEINQLKSNLAEIKANEQSRAPAQDDFEASFDEEPVTEEPAAEESVPEDTDIDFGEADTGSGGFFDMDDGDDTIALSGDELDNIFNSAEFSEVSVDAPADENPEESFNEAFENSVEEESEPTPEASDDDLPTEFVDDQVTVPEEPENDEMNIEESFVEDNSDISLDLPDELNIDSDETSDEMSTEDFDVSTEEETIEDKIEENIGDISNDDDLNFDYENENLEEPNFENEEIALDGDDEQSEELPDEISIPKSDDILVETNQDDFMDSVRDTTEIEEETTPEAEDFGVEAPEVSEESDDLSFDTTETVFDDGAAVEDEPAVEEPSFDEEPVVENEPVVEEETAVSEEEVSDEPFAEIDNPDNNLSESNIDYLTTKEDIPEEEAAVADDSMNNDLKKDIKSVLLYMDQLLENLPEDKIVEFAKSDEFATYKKLFTELGLS